MALVRVVESESDTRGDNIYSQDIADIMREKSIEIASSLPAVPTYKVGLEERAGYKDYGETPEELRSLATSGTKSMSHVESAVAKVALKQPKALKLGDDKEQKLTGVLRWTTLSVCEWIRRLGYPYYVDCFQYNFIDGKKLIHFREVKNLVKLGITDFEHLKEISAAVRALLDVDKPQLQQYQDYIGHMSVSLPPESADVLYLENVSRSGNQARCMTFEEYKMDVYDKKLDRAANLPTGDRKWRIHRQP